MYVCGGGGGGLYLTLLYHHQNDFCIKVESDERHFKVSSIVKDKAARRCPQTTPFEEKRSRSEAESNRGRPLTILALFPLGQTGSGINSTWLMTMTVFD